jgi:hypothetical protein
MHREIAIAIAAGLASTMIMVLPVFALPFAMLSPFFPLPLLLCGLSRGLTSAAIGMAIFGLAMSVLTPESSALPVVAIYGLPALLLVWLALQNRPDEDGNPVWQPVGEIVSSMSVYFVAGTAAAVVAMGGVQATLDLLTGLMSDFMTSFADVMASGGSDMPADAVDQMTTMLVNTMPAFIVIYTALMYLLNGMFAQNILAKRGAAIRPTPVYRDMVLPRWMPMAFGAGVVFWFMAPVNMSFVALAVLAALAMPLFLAGLAVMHSLTIRMPARALWLSIFYALVLLLTGYAVALVTALGLLDHLTGLRARFAASGPTDEE